MEMESSVGCHGIFPEILADFKFIWFIELYFQFLGDELGILYHSGLYVQTHVDKHLKDQHSCSTENISFLQGHLFLSPRIIEFYANIFGNKTNFFSLERHY